MIELKLQKIKEQLAEQLEEKEKAASCVLYIFFNLYNQLCIMFWYNSKIPITFFLSKRFLILLSSKVFP